MSGTKGNVPFERSRVLVTGGLGFIGSNLVRRLAREGAAITVVDSLDPDGGANEFNLEGLESSIVVHRADLRRLPLRELVAGCDYLFHLAARTGHMDSVRSPGLDLEANVAASLDLLEACRDVNRSVRIIFTSTRQVYGTPRYLPVDEAHPLAPPDFNAVHKITVEQYLRLYHQIYGVRSVVLRLTNTYGPRMRIRDARQMFLGVWIRNLLEGLPIDVYGDGLQVRDFNHVDDVVGALLVAGLSADSVSCFNLGGRERLALKDVAQFLTAATAGANYRVVPFPPGQKSIDIGDYSGDYSRFNALTGWSPGVDFADGLRGTVEYYAAHGAHYI